MKRYLLLVFLIVMGMGYAQNSINYKAVIRDNNGSIIANSAVQVQFSILQGVAQTNVYSETHSPTTDANGLVVLGIGEGTTSDDFQAIAWELGEFSLNVQIDTGSGLVDMGTTEFQFVPYAFRANEAGNVSGLEALNEGNGRGWRLIGRNEVFYGLIGVNAVDLSFSNDNLSSNGATGDRSLAAGANTSASGSISTAMGSGTNANGGASTALGFNSETNEFAALASGQFAEANGIASTSLGNATIAQGNNSFAAGSNTLAEAGFSVAMGNNTLSNSYNSMSVGRYNIGGGNTQLWVPDDPLFEIGNGSIATARSNAVTVLKNGNTGIGTHTPQERLHIVGGRLRIGNETIEDGGTDVLAFSSSLVPTIDEADRLGGPNRKWLDIWALDGTINTSDRRQKKNIKDLNYGLSEVLQMQPVSFNWKNKNNPDTKLGLIAQEVLKLVPEVVKTHVWERDAVTGTLTKTELERFGVYYSDLVPVLIKAIQEQQDIINTQTATIQQQQSTNKKQSEILETLLSRVDALENANNQ